MLSDRNIQQPSDDKDGSYEIAFCDLYGGLVFDKKIIFSKTDFMSYLTQTMYAIARGYAFSGNFKFSDDQLVFPRGINDYLMLAQTVTAETESKIPTPQKYVVGFKICIGGRLLIIRNNSDRYVYDCGKLKTWLSFFGKNFDSMTTIDIYFIRCIYQDVKDIVNQASSEKDYQILLDKIKESIIKFNSEYRTSFQPVHATYIADFFVNGKIDILSELSYREIGLAMNDSIVKSKYSSLYIVQLFRQLIYRNSRDLHSIVDNIPHLPLLVATTMLSEHGRNYYSALANVMLLDLVGSKHKLIATKSPINWIDTIIPNEICRLTKELSRSDLTEHEKKKLNAKIRKLAESGGYFCMSHTSSFFEHTISLGHKSKSNESQWTPAFYLKQALYGREYSSSLLGGKLNFLFQSIKKIRDEEEKEEKSSSNFSSMFNQPTEPNLSTEKGFMTIAEWLVLHNKGNVKILSKKQYNSLIKNIQPGYQIGSIDDFMRLFLPTIKSQLDPNIWYDDTSVNTLLTHYLSQDPGIRTIPTLPLGNQDDITPILLSERLATEFLGHPDVNVFYLPLRINDNHWIGLYIDKTPGNPLVYWVDPYGGLSNNRKAQILTILQNIFSVFNIQLTNEHIHFPEQKLQDDGFNCGPWVVEILKFIRIKGRFPNKGEININSCRNEHYTILFPAAQNVVPASIPSRSYVFNKLSLSSYPSQASSISSSEGVSNEAKKSRIKHAIKRSSSMPLFFPDSHYSPLALFSPYTSPQSTEEIGEKKSSHQKIRRRSI